MNDRDYGRNSPLKSIQWKGVIDGPLLKFRSIQSYENTTDKTIEIHYSFPLPYGNGVLTKFSAVINGVRRTAQVYSKLTDDRDDGPTRPVCQRAPNEAYEKMLEEGNSPVCLELSEQDFCTASIGNLKPGEKAEIEVEFLRLLEYQGNKLRITIPTVLDRGYSRFASEAERELAGLEAGIFGAPCMGAISWVSRKASP